jgi:hypothetical protein
MRKKSAFRRKSRKHLSSQLETPPEMAGFLFGPGSELRIIPARWYQSILYVAADRPILDFPPSDPSEVTTIIS